MCNGQQVHTIVRVRRELEEDGEAWFCLLFVRSVYDILRFHCCMTARVSSSTCGNLGIALKHVGNDEYGRVGTVFSQTCLAHFSLVHSVKT